MKEKETKFTAIIGAGPVGLAAAAHLLERGEKTIIFEAGPEPAYAIKQWQHVKLFSPWEFNVDKAAKRLLAESGWSQPRKTGLPTGKEFREKYLLPLAALPSINKHLRLNSKVMAVSRKNWDKVKDHNRENYSYILNIKQSNGEEYQVEAKSVIDTSGTWFNPNPIGSSGIAALGEKANQGFISYGIPDVLTTYRSTYEGKDVAVVGSGHSAMQVVLDLIKLQDENPGSTIHWIMRSTTLAKVFGGGKNDQLEARGELGERARKAVERGKVKLHTPFLLQKIERLRNESNRLLIMGEAEGVQQQIKADRIIGTTGFRPDLDIIREVRTAIDPAIESVADLAPLIDPNIHSCGSVPPHGVNELKHPDENFFIAGIKSYGRAPNFLLATGYEQVRSIAAYLTGDFEAADRIELHLPETGVCSTDFILETEGQDKQDDECCGGPANEDADACCVLDAEAKAAGESGCGCGSETPTPVA